MSVPTDSPESFAAICQAIASLYTTRRNHGYHATRNQVVFFTIAATQKAETKQTKPDGDDHDDVAAVWRDKLTVADIAHATAHQLDGLSGEVVTGLKQGARPGPTQKDPVEWCALVEDLQRMQRRLARQLGCQLDQAIQDEALEKSLFKVLNLIRAMPEGAMLDAAMDMLAFSNERLAQPGALYNFRNPFLSYVFRILQNEFRQALKKSANNFRRFRSLEEALHLQSESADLDKDLDAEAAYLHQRSQLQQLLPRLLDIIETLPRKRRQVAAYTLTGRSQFWLALQLAELQVPSWYPPVEEHRTDRQIAAHLGMTDNSVRANRRYVCLDIAAKEPDLDQLFSSLIDVYF